MGEFKVHRVRFFDYQPLAIHCLAYDRTTQRLALSRSDGSVEVWSKPDNWFQEKVIALCDQQSVEGLAWLHSRLFSVGLDGHVKEYDLGALQVKRQAASVAGPLWCIVSNEQDSQLAVGAEDGCVVLYSATDDDLQYHRSFDKLEGRILCIAWHVAECVVVTGGPDVIRIWSAKSGHALQRIVLGGKDTIVWCLAITSDLTIVSGDSRGMISFWNGKHGTRIAQFRSHKADVLTLCVDKTETSVYCGGVDPSVVCFAYMADAANSGWKSWVRSFTLNNHTHDVRASLVAENTVVTGGLDTNLICTPVGKKGKFVRLAPVPSQSMVCVARDAGLLLLRYPTCLELWRLGHTTATSDVNGEMLPLKSAQIKLLQLKARKGEVMACSAISSDGSLVAFSDQEVVRVFRLKLTAVDSLTPSVEVKRVSLSPKDDVQPAQRLAIIPNNRRLLVATSAGTLQVWDVDDCTAHLHHTIPGHGEGRESWTNLAVSDNGHYAATSTTGARVHLYSLKTAQLLCCLPTLPHQATSLGFAPGSRSLLVTYTNHCVYEFDVAKQEYTAWTRSACEKFPDQWLRQRGCLRGVMAQPGDAQQIFTYSELDILVIKKKLPMPEKNYPLFFTKPGKRPKESSAKRPLVACSKYKLILHAELLSWDSLVVVERTALDIHLLLDSAMLRKKFGT